MSINLMPWREERRRRVQKDFATKLGLSAILGLSVVVLVFLAVSTTVSGQTKRNTFMEARIDDANKAIVQVKDLEKQKEAMLNRKKVIESLQANRDQLAHLYYELAINSEDGIILNSMEEKNKILEIKGKSISNSAVASFMNKIETSPWFDKPEIIVIQNDELNKTQAVNITDPSINRYGYDFTIKTGVKNPNLVLSEDEGDASSAKKPKSAKDRRRK